jgi:AraC family transcriptional regulator of arabinose operon
VVDPAWWPASVNAGEIVYPPGGTYGPRVQREYQIVAVHSGWVRLTLDGDVHRFDAGVAFLLRPGRREYFQFATDGPTRHSWAAAHVPGMPETMLEGFGAAPPVVRLSPELQRLVRMAAEYGRAESALGRDLCVTLVRAALLCFWRAAGLGGGRRPVHAAVARAREAARARLAEPLRLEDLAAAAAVSGEHLCRLFRADLGVSPMGYLWTERTREGLRLLAASGLSVQEVAERCGFRTTFHFARRVRQATGISPTAYRARHWNGAG